MMNRAVVILLAMTAMMASSATAFALDYRSDHSGYTCHEKPPAVSIQVVAPELKVEVDTSLDADQIGALARSDAGGSLKIESDHVIEGLTILPNIDYNLTVEMAFVKETGRVCLWPQDLTMKFSFPRPMLVYLDKKYPPSTCQYGPYREHEFQHVQFNLDGYKHMFQYSTAALKQHAMDVAVSTQGESADDLAAVLKTRVAASVAEAMKRAYAELEAKHAIIDAEANIKRIQGLCPD